MKRTPYSAAALTLAFVLSLSPADGGTPQVGGSPEQAPRPAFDHTHAAWTAVLRAHVRGERFDYAALQRERAPLDGYLTQLHGVTPAELATWSRAERFAFWINLYNAHAVKLVVDGYPLASILELGDERRGRVWDQGVVPLPALHPDGAAKGTGKPLSLDDVENRILRPTFADARVHVALNCASRACPPLRAEAYVAARLDAQLDDQARRFVADAERNRFERATRTAHVSALFDWFRADFERDAGSVPEWLARHADPELAAWLRASKPELRYLEFSWELNGVVAER